MKRVLATLLCALAATACGGGGSSGGGGGGPIVVSPPPPPPPASPPPVSGQGLFSLQHPWTKDVSALAKSTRSDAIIGQLVASGGWGAGNELRTDFTISLLSADSSTPRRTVTAPAGGYCFGGPDCDAVPIQVPLPAGGNTEGSANYTCNTAANDCHVLVYERNERKLYELYQATQAGAGFTAYGAFVWDLDKQYTDVLRGDQCTSADAAGLPMAALLPTADEVAAGTVPHALRFILPNARMKRQVYVRPATHAGGGLPAPTPTRRPMACASG